MGHNETKNFCTAKETINKTKRQTIASVSEDVEKLKPSYIAGGNVK